MIETGKPKNLRFNRESIIAGLAVVSISTYLALHFLLAPTIILEGLPIADWPLVVGLVLGGTPLVAVLIKQVFRREFGSDLLAGISIVASVSLHQYLAGTIVVLMLSGGQALENFAVGSASSVLQALAKRMPSIAHRKQGEAVVDVPVADLSIGDLVSVFPNDICPIDGSVVEGHGVMDESYLTGEPYMIEKAPGSDVLSGAVNGPSLMVIKSTKLASDSRYAKIMEVMRNSAQRRPRMRRIADELGAFYTPLAVAIALGAWAYSHDPMRFLAVLVIATPCPLLIGIPVAIIGSISLAAKRGIVIKDPTVLETISTCKVMMFDKTGTLTYGRPLLTEIVVLAKSDETSILTLVASLERYSKHPLAEAILEAAKTRKIALSPATEVSEQPGHGLIGLVNNDRIEVTGRGTLDPPEVAKLPSRTGQGLECIVKIDQQVAAMLRFRDEPRADGLAFVKHLGSRHGFERVMLVSGDHDSEVRHLATLVGIQEIHGDQSPEQKLDLVRKETEHAHTVFVGDGINDAPALTAATVGIAFGQKSDITAEAAGAVIMDSSLEKVDELLHISRRMRTIALQSAIGGMILSIVGMGFASAGLLTPVVGAVIQEVIDVLAVLNALRVAFPPKKLTDY